MTTIPRAMKDQDGIAMAICLFVMAMLSGITAAALSMSRSDLAMSRNYRSASQGLATAEAGVLHAQQIINRVGVIDLRNDVIDYWSGRYAPFSANPRPMTQETRFAYSVQIATDPYHASDRNRGLMTSTATGADNSVRQIEAFVIKSDIPNAPPGALYLATDHETDATFRGDSFIVNGNDVNYSNNQAGTKPAVPGITTRKEDNAQEARNSLNDNQKDNIQGMGFIPGDPAVPSIAAGLGPSTAQITQLIEDLLALPHVTNSERNINGIQTFGTEASPQITYFNNSEGATFTANGNASGAGIMIVEHSLTITGSLDFKGLIIVRGETDVSEITGHALIWGSLWTTDFDVMVGGNADVQYSSEALIQLANHAGGAGTTTLPAPVKIYAWRDVF